MQSRFKYFLAFAVVLGITASAFSQQRTYTAEDYKRAEKFMGYNTNPLVLRSGVRPTWLPDERFWYRVMTEKGAEFILVDPNTGGKEPAFDHAKLAAALSTASGTTYTAYNLPFQQFEMSSDGKSITFNAGNRGWTCDRQGTQCTAAAATPAGQGQRGQRGGGAAGSPPVVPSPDGKKAALIRNNNLWVRDVATGQEKQLTTDGVQDYGYATDNAGWTKSD